MGQLPNLQPSLSGELVSIRPLQADDWEPLLRVASNPQVWAQHPVPTRYKEDEFSVFFDGALATNSAFALIENKFGALIGSSRFYGYNEEQSEIEIGWTFLGTQYWGGAYNAEVKKLMLDYAFGFVDTVIFWVGKDNKRSRRAMEKTGGVLRAGLHTRPLSGDMPYVIYEIKAESWHAEQKT